eukprot:7146922-Lingulodinium_polyedra.AAC.1
MAAAEQPKVLPEQGFLEVCESSDGQVLLHKLSGERVLLHHRPGDAWQLHYDSGDAFLSRGNE